MENTSIEYGGQCAFAVSLGKKDVKGTSHATINGKTYAFSNPVAKILFRLIPGRVKKADENWSKRAV